MLSIIYIYVRYCTSRTVCNSLYKKLAANEASNHTEDTGPLYMLLRDSTIRVRFPSFKTLLCEKSWHILTSLLIVMRLAVCRDAR